MIDIEYTQEWNEPHEDEDEDGEEGEEEQGPIQEVDYYDTHPVW